MTSQQERHGTSNADLHRDLGRLEGRLESMEGRQSSFEETVRKSFACINEKLDALNDFSSFGRGAWKSVTIFGAVFGTIVLGAAGLISWAITDHESSPTQDVPDIYITPESTEDD